MFIDQETQCVSMSILPKLTYRIKATPVKCSAKSSVEIAFPKIYVEREEPWNS